MCTGTPRQASTTGAGRAYACPVLCLPFRTTLAASSSSLGLGRALAQATTTAIHRHPRQSYAGSRTPAPRGRRRRRGGPRPRPRPPSAATDSVTYPDPDVPVRGLSEFYKFIFHIRNLMQRYECNYLIILNCKRFIRYIFHSLY